MPTYDYECKSCGHVFETMHAMSLPPLRKCPECGKLKLVRLISGGAGVIFKGSGFYETDYKRNRRGADSAQNDSSKDKDKDKKDDKPSESPKSETKPDGKSDSKSESKSESKHEKGDGKPKKDAGAKKKD
jgi:putative FmdB family regulatory protein